VMMAVTTVGVTARPTIRIVNDRLSTSPLLCRQSELVSESDKGTKRILNRVQDNYLCLQYNQIEVRSGVLTAKKQFRE